MKYTILLAIICFFLIESTTQNSSSQDGYIFTSPRRLNLGSTNELNFKSFGDLDGGTLVVQVFYKKNYHSNETKLGEKEFEITKGEKDAILNFPLDKTNERMSRGRIQINGTFGSKKISGSGSVDFAPPKSSILIIQTDKPFYKPGQTVKFRIVRVNKNLKPYKENSIADIEVFDPKGTKLFQFKNEDLAKGIIQKEFPVSEEPLLGKWTIKVQSDGVSENAVFDVKEYELPKFEIHIKFPPFVLVTTKLIPITICANYIYGEPVIGSLNLTASLDLFHGKGPTVKNSVQIDGCYNFKLNVSKIEEKNTYSYRRIKVFANVLEKETGVKRSKIEYLQRVTSPLALNFIDSLDSFKPGLPYNGKLKVSNPDATPAADEPIRICAKVFKRRVIAHWWATKTLEICKNYTSDQSGIIKFVLVPQNDVISVNLNAISLKYKTDSEDSSEKDNVLQQPQTGKELMPYFSPSGSFIQIQPVHEPIACESTVTLKFLYTAKKESDFKFYYQVSKQGSLVLFNSFTTLFSSGKGVSNRYENKDNLLNVKIVQLNPPVHSDDNEEDNIYPEAAESQYLPPFGEAKFDIEVNSTLSPEIHVLVYYVRDDNEVVADSMKIPVKQCFPNKVTFSFGEDRQQPGLETAIKIKSAPSSLCGIKVFDKSMTLLDNSDNLRKEKIFEMLTKFDSNIYSKRNPCFEDNIQPGLDNAAFKSLRSPFTGSSSSEDSFTAFQTSGFVVISNLFIVNRPCSNSYEDLDDEEYFVVSGNSGIRTSFVTKSVSDVRDYFPEIWLFEMDMTGPDGTLVMNKKLPDTITDWVGNAVCIGEETGLGISNSTSITAFQAFFLDYTLPMSVIRGEEFVVIVSVFNYVDEALPVTLTLDNSKAFEIVGDSVEGDICVQPKSKKNLRFTLKATQIGKVNLTIQAETSRTSSACGNSAISRVYAKDAIRKPIEIEPEGFPNGYVINSLFCPSEEVNNIFESKMKLTLPDDVVPDSERAYVDITGNVMGPAINNLDHLVSLPTGSGEQNMVKFTPNYLVLDYLKDIGMLTEDRKIRALNNLNTGYQRALTYRHDDGSFSAFGKTDNDGSLFLTSFVLRSFYEAQRYISVDDAILKKMQDFIVSKQQADGCFLDDDQINNKNWQGGLKDSNSSADITAYVLASLSISKLENAKVIEAAFKCLQNNKPSSPYIQLLYAYAEALVGKTSEAKYLLDEARQRINRTGGMESFILENGTESIRIESDAYAVLTTLAVGGTAEDALPYIRYLTTHLNPNGGFQSVQDTCIGLEALSKFAALVYKKTLNLEVTTNGVLDETLKITDSNKLLVQRFKASKVPGEIDIKATGVGCGLIQTSVRYNSIIPPEQKKFSLEVNGKCINSNCNEANLHVLISYLPEGLKSGLSVMQIKMLTGFVPYKGSINKLKHDKSTVLRIDVENNTVIIYLSEVSNAVQQFSFKVSRIVEVRNPLPGSAKVYDYYANENTSSTSYTIDNK